MMDSTAMSVAIFDYGAGNLHSLAKAVAGPAVRVFIEEDALRAVDRRAYDSLILPGVGAFAAAAARLAPARAALRAVIDDGFPVVGICLGMQLLFDSSEEGEGLGLGVIPGVVRRLRATRVPQIGWNSVEQAESTDSMIDVPTLDLAYYANSYVCAPEDERCISAWTTYENDRFAAAVRAGPLGNVAGVQFHPEKSSRLGVEYLRALLARASSELRR